MNSLRVEGIRKSFGVGPEGRVEALADVSVDVGAGQMLVIVGPSGAGKSTLLRVIAGLETPDSGRVCLDDRDVTSVSPLDRDAMMVLQEDGLYPDMTVEDNVGFGLRLRGVGKSERRRRTESVIAKLGLSELIRRRPGELSGGERRRVSLARVMVLSPRVLLFDEPLAQLDPERVMELRRDIQQMVQDLQAFGVYVTHDATEALSLADRLAVLDRGRLLQLDVPEAVYRRPASVPVARFFGRPPINLFTGRLLPDGRTLEVDLGNGAGPVSWPWAGELPLEPSGPVTIGIRPERMCLHSEASSQLPVMSGRVCEVEYHGADQWVRVCRGSLPEPASWFWVRVDGQHPVRVGEPVNVSWEAGCERLFDPDSGAALPVDEG